MKDINLGDLVWRVQKGNEWKVVGPARVTAIISRRAGTTYLLTWKHYRGNQDVTTIEIQDEQDPEFLFLSEEEAKQDSNLRHNSELKAKMR